MIFSPNIIKIQKTKKRYKKRKVKILELKT